jgi:hypothetical protein
MTGKSDLHKVVFYILSGWVMPRSSSPIYIPLTLPSPCRERAAI